MIYIQSDDERSIPHHFDVACSMYGAIETVKNYRLTSFDEIKSGKFDSLIKSNLFVGSVEFMREVFKRAGIEDPRVPENSNRLFEVISLGEARKRAQSGEKLFIKPFEIKLFTGFVIDEMINTSISDVPDETPVMAYEVFREPIESEWRCYIHRNKVVDIRNYSGDIFTYPDEIYLLDVVWRNKDKFPIAYTVDIAILESGSNEVVEFNDMWAIGNYGIPNDLYLRLLRDRYFEIIRG